MIDQAKTLERRNSERFGVTIDTHWEGPDGRQSGTVSDISHGGCFVLTGTRVKSGDQIDVYLPFGDGMKAKFSGKVCSFEPEIGFGVRFFELNSAQIDILQELVFAEP